MYLHADQVQESVFLNRSRNKIINGNFDIWQRGTSQTTSGYGSDDRWVNANSGSSKTHSQQTFTLGQTNVPGNPKYYSRTVVTSIAGASNYVLKAHKIEDVGTFAGQNVTLSFYAKADAAKDIALEFQQNFGSGGSPSASVQGIGVNTISLTTSWAKYEITVSIPSISGKTLGTNNDDFLQVTLWFDAGSDFNTRTNTLGQQSGTFDIAQVQLEEGSVATDFERRTVGEELALCQRYYEASDKRIISEGYVNTTIDLNQTNPYKVRKRAVPTVSTTGITYSNMNSLFINGANSGVDSFESSATGETAGARGYYLFNWSADAEL